EQFGQDSYLARGVLSGRPKNIDAPAGNRIIGHHRNEGAGGQIILDKAIRKPCKPEAGCRGGSESGAVVGLEASVRPNGDRLVSVYEVPALGPLHQRLMGEEFDRGLRSAILADVVRARDELCVDWPDVARHHVRVSEIANAYCTVEAFP